MHWMKQAELDIDELIAKGWKINIFYNEFCDGWISWMQNIDPEKNDLAGVGDTREKSIESLYRDYMQSKSSFGVTY